MMAKFGMGMGGGAASPAAIPAPAAAPVVPVTQPGRTMGGIFAPSTDPARYEMAMAMLTSAMTSAGGAQSPLLSLLAPIAYGVLAPKLNKMRDDAKAQQVSDMTESILGPDAMSPRARRAMEIMENPDAPDYLKDIARTMFKGSVPLATPSGGRRRASSAGGGSSRPARLTYIQRDPDGIVRGYNAATGRREVVPNADAGADVPAGEDPLGLRAPAETDNDPLGIRQ